MNEPTVISFGGGKGGIGKTTLLANVGAMLSIKGYRVCFVDADLGGANLHLHLGRKRPKKSLTDFIKNRETTLDDIQLDNIVQGTKLISGAGELLNLTNPRYTQKEKLIKAFKNIDADYILVDLGAGSSSNTTDFFTAYENGVVVSDTLPASIENAYMFLKNSITRGLIRLFTGNSYIKKIILDYANMRLEKIAVTIADLVSLISKEDSEAGKFANIWLGSRKFYLVLNMIKMPEEIQAGKKFMEIVKKYLNVSIHYVGYVLTDGKMRTCAKKNIPVILDEPSETTYNSFSAITENLIVFTKGSN